MQQCPLCGGGAERDPEHCGVMRCMSCWEVWVLPDDRPCPGVGRGVLAPALRLLEEYRDLNR